METTRLHISLTAPHTLTPSDISTRLSTFGTVLSLTANKFSDPQHPYGFVTLEATPAQLARCRTTLNGSTWKGAKIRIAEAKPDWTERIANEIASQHTPKKHKPRYSKYSAVYAPDMSLVTSPRPGWRVTSTGRLLRPMRMRPERPLPPPTDKREGNTKNKARVRVKPPPTRARRRTIDTRRWEGATPYLKGALLQNFVAHDESSLAAEKTQTVSCAQLPESSLAAEKTQTVSCAQNKLKDLFKPRQDDGHFSLLGHLGEFEMEEDEGPPPTNLIEPPIPTPTPNPTTTTLDPKAPLFFPRLSDRTRDTARERGWVHANQNVLAPGSREWWETNKAELTRGWKKRHKDAKRLMRRRGGDSS